MTNKVQNFNLLVDIPQEKNHEYRWTLHLTTLHPSNFASNIICQSFKIAIHVLFIIIIF